MKTSINIKYDVGNTNLIDEYYATNAHSAIIKGVLSGATGESSTKSHIAYGPYGSGKSYISTILSSLLSKKYDKKQILKIQKKYEVVDDSITEIIAKAAKTEWNYIPIVLNGYEGDFSKVVLRTLSKALKDNNINIYLPGIYNDIKKIIERWKSDYPQTYILFDDAIDKYSLTIDEFISMLNKRDDNVIEIFNKIHKELTAGSEFFSFENTGLIETLETVSIELSKRKIGLFIVYDEFGRLLQTINDNTINSFMQTLQDIAELSNNGVDNLSTLFIAHRPISYYFTFASKDLRSEFAKVEKRFSVYEIKSDYTTFLRITEGYINDNDIRKSNNIDLLLSETRKYNVFYGSLSETEVENIIVKNLNPLHPVSTFLIPKISSIFGQNERTLFTFLSDNSTRGLKGFANTENGLYYPDYLVDYFLTGIDDSYIEDSKDYEIYKKNIDSLPTLIDTNNIDNAVRIYKFLLIWSLAKSYTNIKLTTDFIAYAIGVNGDKIKIILDMFTDLKIARFNIIHEQWEIFEGSTLDLNKEINKKIGMTNFSEIDFISTLEDHNPYKYIFPESYNAKYEMTRFATIQYVTTEFKNNFKLIDKTDYNIVVSLGCEFTQGDEIIHHSKPTKKLIKEVFRLKIINGMIKDQYYLSNYPNVDIELEYEKAKIEKGLNDFYLKTVLKEYNDFQDLNRKLSIKMEERFPKSFHIVNDQINMFTLTNIQKRALERVIDKVLNENSLNVSEYFQGSKPTDLIYYTIVEKLRNDQVNQDSFEHLTGALTIYLENHTEGHLKNIFNLATKAPYGLRPHVAILITFMIVIDQWKDMLLFNKGNFIPSIEVSELVEEITNRDTELTYVFSRFDNKNRNFLEGLEAVFGEVTDTIKGKTLSVRVCSSMYNWYLNLPVITQQMVDLGLSDRSFLEIIAKSRINPKKAIDELLLTFPDITTIEMFKTNLEKHFNDYKEALIKRTFLQLGVTDINSWAKEQDPIHKKNYKLVSTIINDEDIYQTYMNDVENIDIEKWTQSSFKTMQKLIMNDFEKLDKNQAYQTVSINGENKFIQDVSLSLKAENALQNLEATIDATKKYYSRPELELVILNLVNKYIK